jgi:hypothetical protein
VPRIPAPPWRITPAEGKSGCAGIVSDMSDTPEAPQPAEPVAPAVGAAPAVPLPPENKTRGTLLALLAIPAGVIVWSIIWAIGFISGWVPLGVALIALALYRKGSGGRIGYDAAIRLSVILLVTMFLALAAGIMVSAPSYFATAVQRGVLIQGIIAQFGHGNEINAVLLGVFTLLGVVIIFRTAATTLKQQAALDAGASTS